MALMLLQLTVTVIVGLYFYRQLRGQERSEAWTAGGHSHAREMEKLNALRRIRLSVPLAERVRPAKLEDVVGQQEGIKALKAILCRPIPNTSSCTAPWGGQDGGSPSGAGSGQALRRNALSGQRALYRDGRHLRAV